MILGSHKLIRLAHKQKLPVYEFCKRLYEKYGSFNAAGRAIGVKGHQISLWLKNKTPKRKLIRLADAKGMNPPEFVAEMVMKYGGAGAAERALGFAQGSFQNALKAVGLPMYSLPRLTATQNKLILDMLKSDQYTHAQIAKAAKCSVDSVYRRQHKRLQFQSKRDVLKNEVRLAIAKRDSLRDG